MALKIAAGRMLNLVARSDDAASNIVAYSTAGATLLTADKAIDGRPSSRYQAGAVGAAHLRQSLELGTNGGFEAHATQLQDWTTSGTWTIDNTTFSDGAQCAKCDGVGTAYQRWTVCPGEQIRVKCAIRGDGAHAATITVENERTGRFLQSDGTWIDTSVAAVLSRSANSWGTASVDTTVESTSDDTVTLVVCLRAPADALSKFDAIYCLPGVNLICALGHNLGRRATMTASVSDILSYAYSDAAVSAFSATTSGDFAAPLGVPHAIKTHSSLQYGRSAELSWACSQTYHAAHGVGEWIMAQAWDIGTPRAPHELAWEDLSGTRGRTRSGAHWYSGLDVLPPRKCRVSIFLQAVTSISSVIDRFAVATRGGRDPVLIVSDDVVSGTVLYGYLESPPVVAWRDELNAHADLDFSIEDEPVARW